MKKLLRNHILLLILFACGLACAGVILCQRAAVERDYKTYDIVMDYADLLDMADQSEHDVGWWLEFFRDQGIKKIGLYETSVAKLYKDKLAPVYYQTVKSITADAGWQSQYPDAVADMIRSSSDFHDLLVVVSDADIFDWIMGAFSSRTDKLVCQTYSDGGVFYLFIDGTYGISEKDWPDFNLGLWPATVEFIESYGYEIVPRFNTIDGLNDVKFTSALLDGYSMLSSTPVYFMNGGKSMLGSDEYEQSMQVIDEYLEETGAAIALTEDSTQLSNVTWKGFDSFISSHPGQAVRVFNEWGYIQWRYAYYGYSSSEEIQNSLFRAVVERNCRVIYFRMILDTDSDTTYITDTQPYELLLSGLFERLDAQGYRFGTAVAIGDYTPSWILRLMVGFGAIAAAVLLLCAFVPLRPVYEYILLALGMAGVAAAMYLIPNTSKLLLCIGAGCVMPSLTAVLLMRYLGDIAPRLRGSGTGAVLLRSAAAFIACALITLCGAIYTSSALSQTTFMLELDIYRGVKVMQLIPIAVYIVAYLFFFTPEDAGIVQAPGLYPERVSIKRLRSVGRDMMRRPVHVSGLVKTITVIFSLLLAGGLGIYYLARTGHSSTAAEISTFELTFRSFLENILVARPRSKEFLIGFPCLMLFVSTRIRGGKFLPFLFGLGMSIGMTSIINTFLHIRTPLYISFARTGYSVLFGLILGAIAVWAVDLINRRWVRTRENNG